ncbi:flagellar hook-length control protein FliK [Paludibacterium denitrificans]|uniref:flagellar hook-length control protein FliK n=1 Tax=Paludibacterium denitrificans TaxID=2675226 RepID=UPI001E479D4E|nr:flagellar hook-length control protein FliK [Paludibacterium denitrificans]
MNARIRLVGQTVQVSFVAEESQAGRLIETNMARLQSGMESAGLTLASLVVKHDEAPS